MDPYREWAWRQSGNYGATQKQRTTGMSETAHNTQVSRRRRGSPYRCDAIEPIATGTPTSGHDSPHPILQIGTLQARSRSASTGHSRELSRVTWKESDVLGSVPSRSSMCLRDSSKSDYIHGRIFSGASTNASGARTGVSEWQSNKLRRCRSADSRAMYRDPNTSREKRGRSGSCTRAGYVASKAAALLGARTRAMRRITQEHQSQRRKRVSRRSTCSSVCSQWYAREWRERVGARTFFL
jgi:hypothetical protein